jgi:outer membrane protein assembly factor BamB
MKPGPRRLLVNDEGSSALHYVDLDAPERCWIFRGAGRDLQLIGEGKVLRSTPTGFVELELATGELVRQVEGHLAVESARRLPNGQTVLLGNDEGGIRLQQLDRTSRVVASRLAAGLLKGRLARHTSDGTILFCSETDGRRTIHEFDFESGLRTSCTIPGHVPADSMVKAVRLGNGNLLVSTGYAASVIEINPGTGDMRTVGGKQQAEPPGQRRLVNPNFFSGYQVFADGSILVANWQGHGPSHGPDGYQLLMYAPDGSVAWAFDQTEYPVMTSLNNVIALDDLDVSRLHDERTGPHIPLD